MEVKYRAWSYDFFKTIVNSHQISSKITMTEIIIEENLQNCFQRSSACVFGRLF